MAFVNDALQLITTDPSDPRKYILGIDPGKTSGFAIYSLIPKERDSLKFERWWEVNISDYSPTLEGLTFVTKVGIEDFILRPTGKGSFLTKGKGYHTLDTAKLIGRVEQWAYTNKIQCVVNQPAEKPMGYKMAKLPYVAGKQGTHMMDAAAHARLTIRKVYQL